MGTYVKRYTPDSIKLSGRIKGDTAYLSLVFSYGYCEQVMTAKGLQKVYSKLTMGVGTVDARYWGDGDFRESFVRGHAKEYAKLTAKIESARAQVWAAYTKLKSNTSDPDPTPEQIMNAIKGEQQANIRLPFVEFIRDFGRTAKSPLTMAKYMTLANMYEIMQAARKVEPFQFLAEGKGDITVQNYSPEDWADMTKLIQSVGDSIRIGDKVGDLVWTRTGESGFYGWNTLEKFQQNTRAVLNYAIRKGIKLNVVPAQLPKVARKDVDRTCLSLDQVAELVAARFDEPHLENVRRLFVLQCFTGVAISDVQQMLDAPIDIVKGRQITFRAITNVRQKTKTPFCVPVLAPVWDILGGNEPKPFIPKFTQQYNDHLKVVCQRLGFDNITVLAKPKADGTTPLERSTVAELTSTHMGRAIFKMIWEEEAMIHRSLVTSVMAHTLDDKSADVFYRRMTRERKAELFLIQASAVQMPFPVMPPPVITTTAA